MKTSDSFPTCKTCIFRRPCYTTGKTCHGGWCGKWSDSMPGVAIVLCSEIRGCLAHKPGVSK